MPDCVCVFGAAILPGSRGITAARSICRTSQATRLSRTLCHVRAVWLHGASRTAAHRRPCCHRSILAVLRELQGAVASNASQLCRCTRQYCRTNWYVCTNRPHARRPHAAGGRQVHGCLASRAKRCLVYPKHAHCASGWQLTSPSMSSMVPWFHEQDARSSWSPYQALKEPEIVARGLALRPCD